MSPYTCNTSSSAASGFWSLATRSACENRIKSSKSQFALYREQIYAPKSRALSSLSPSPFALLPVVGCANRKNYEFQCEPSAQKARNTHLLLPPLLQSIIIVVVTLAPCFVAKRNAARCCLRRALCRWVIACCMPPLRSEVATCGTVSSWRAIKLQLLHARLCVCVRLKLYICGCVCTLKALLLLCRCDF